MTTPRALSDEELNGLLRDYNLPLSIIDHISFLNTRIKESEKDYQIQYMATKDALDLHAKEVALTTKLQARIEELEKEFNAAQKRFETTSELSCERAIEIEELKEQRATLKSENEKLKAENGELRGKADHYSNLFDKLEELSRPSIHSSPWEAVRLACEDGKKYHEGLRELSTLRQLCDDMHDKLVLILPLAKGYAAHNPVGSNQTYITEVEQALSKYNSTKGNEG